MAITKMMHMKASSKARIDIHLEHSINYILQPKKLGEANLAGGINCLPEMAYQQMKATVMAVNVEPGLQNEDIREYGETVRLPSDKADYMRMSVAEKVRCYPFDDKGTDTAFEMVRTYFEKIGMDTSFDSVYEEAKLLINYYEKQKEEEFIQERTEQITGAIKLLGLDAGNLAGGSADVLFEVFGFGDMEYFAGMKLFNRVIDRLSINMDRQRRYEVFDRIYEEGMRVKKVERDRNSR